MIKLHLNGVESALRWTNFSDGASTVCLLGHPPVFADTAFITCIADGGLHDNLFHVAQVLDIVRNLNPRIKTTLYIPYTPYARADRHMVDRDSFGLQVYTTALNKLNFDKVVIVDPHSDVAPALINNCKVISQADVIATDPVTSWFSTKDFLLVSPDAGSLKKIGKVASLLKRDVVVLGKDRDVTDGRITNTRILGDSSIVNGRDCIIVDDICDGGGTFIAAAQALYSAGANSVELFVTHGIFSRGLSPLVDAGFTRIITTNSIGLDLQGCRKSEHPDLVRVIECEALYAARNTAGGFR